MIRDKPRFARANDAHAQQVAGSLRASDRKELSVIGISDAAGRLSQIIQLPGDARAVLDSDGRAVAVFGCWQMADGVAAPWMLCATGVRSVRRLILRHGARWVRAWARRWPTLRNASLHENRMHHRFIEACGFVWAGEVQVNGYAFKVFANV